MKAFHISDLHFCAKHLQWVENATIHAVTRAIEWRADVAFLTGDSFDAAINLHDPAVQALIAQVRRIAEHMPVAILQGTFSHDRPGCLDIFKSLRTKHPIYVADRVCRALLLKDEEGIFAWHTVDDNEDFIDKTPLDMIFAFVNFLPSVNRADIQAEHPELATSEKLCELFERWAPQNAEMRALKVPTVLCTHGTVNGCVTESRQSMVSQDHEFGAAALFSAGTDAVMLGHIHAHQGWQIDDNHVTSHPIGALQTMVPRAAYPGSITRLIYGHGDPVGALLWTIGPGGSAYQLFETPGRRLVDIEFDGPPDTSALMKRLEEIGASGAFIRLRYTIDEEHRKSVDKEGLELILKNAGVAESKIEAHVNPVQRTRAAGISKAISTADRLVKWCELTQTNPEPLLKRLTILEQR